MLEKFGIQAFKQIYAIMQDSFPTDEIRPREEQRALTDDPRYRLCGLSDRQGVALFFAAYEWEDLVFIEHFAVRKDCRGQGLGGMALKEFLQTTAKPVCLEVELPETETAKRRIAFYERNGFILHDYPYIQPAIAEGRRPIPLKIMATKFLSGEEFSVVKKRLYTNVYGVKA